MPTSTPAEPGKFRGAAGSGLITSHLALASTVCPPWRGTGARSEVLPLLTAASPVAPVSPVPMCGERLARSADADRVVGLAEPGSGAGGAGAGLWWWAVVRGFP